jgi:plasmid stabilization system protein ParE
MRYTVRPAARADLKRHWHVIAKDNPPAADRFVAAAEVEFAKIAADPLLLGHQLGWRKDAHVRSRSIPGFWRYLIFYRIHPRHVEFKRVLHGARHLPRLFRR